MAKEPLRHRDKISNFSSMPGLLGVAEDEPLWIPIAEEIPSSSTNDNLGPLLA